MIGLVLRLSSGCFGGWSDFVQLRVWNGLFKGLGLVRSNVCCFWLLFVEVLITLVNNIDRFQVDFDGVFDR